MLLCIWIFGMFIWRSKLQRKTVVWYKTAEKMDFENSEHYRQSVMEYLYYGKWTIVGFRTAFPLLVSEIDNRRSLHVHPYTSLVSEIDRLCASLHIRFRRRIHSVIILYLTLMSNFSAPRRGFHIYVTHNDSPGEQKSKLISSPLPMLARIIYKG